MKILVLGASQGTGALCVRSALARGHLVTAFSRTPAKLDLMHPALTKVAGDFYTTLPRCVARRPVRTP